MESSGASLLMTFITWIVVVAIFLGIGIPITRRKGKSVALLVVLCLIPLVGPLYAIWVFSLTDKKVLDRLAALEQNAQKTTES